MFLQEQRHFAAIKNAFSSLLPIIIVGSFCTLISNVICNTNPGYLSLANVPGMAWLGNFNIMFTAANYGTMNFVAIGLVILLAMELGESYGIRDKVLPVVALEPTSPCAPPQPPSPTTPAWPTLSPTP